MRRLFLWSLLCSLAAPAASFAVEPSGAAFFEAKIRPLLIEHCYECHAGDTKQKGGLRLDHRAAWQKGGDSGPAIVVGDPGASLLMRAVRYADPDLQMPPKKKLDVAEIRLLETWIAQGAPDPREGEISASPAVERDWEKERTFWAFQPIAKPVPPRVSKAQEPVDGFVLEALEKVGLEPAPRAERRVLWRRVNEDLLGLPASTDDTERFLADGHENAYDRALDRLLASPRYGERWGRHWLDVARYSDSNGMDENMAYTEAYRYRDYVVDAFNADLPYDQFLSEQLAGDLLDPNDPRLTTATGFLTVGPKMLACDDPEKMRMDIVDEQIDTVGQAFMGMTLGCARCHDHKFDPISAADYYALAGIFRSTKTIVDYKVVAKWHEYDFTPEADRALLKEQASLKEKKDRDEIEEKRFQWLQENAPKAFKVMGVAEDEIADTRVHLRGNYLTLGAEVPRRTPSVFGASPVIGKDESGRLPLARWLTSGEHPLTARVMVNRIWRWHFGRGLVSTTDNFGKLGALPSHPALLDYLANQLVEDGWSVKRLHRRLLGSSTYQQSARHDAAAFEKDPENQWLWRWNRRRLTAESLRDSLLLLGDRLDLRMGGQLLLDASGSYVNRGRAGEYLKQPRRSLYLPIIRSAVYENFVAFDFADPSVLHGDRRDAVVAPQALYLMNADLVKDTARHLAASCLDVDALFHRVLGRPPSDAEARVVAASGVTDREVLARMLLASNAFLYID